MRLALRGEALFNDTNGNDNVAARQVKRLRGTFQSNTTIEMRVAHDDVENIFIVDGFMQPAKIKNREVDDPPTVFRRLGALIFSQEEVTQLADKQKSFSISSIV